jgi:nucleolar protein 14
MEDFDFNILMQEFKKGKGSGLDGYLEEGKFQFRNCLLKKLLSQLETVLDLWKGSPASIEVFSPLYEVIQTLENLGPEWETLVEGLQDLLRVERKPLQLQKFKAQPISTYDPDFDLAFSLDRKGRKCRTDKEREEREMAKLKHEYKKEMKGAIRELRKDNSFIAQEQSRKRKERDQAYNSKIKSIYGLISNEGGEFDKEAKRSKRK